MGKAGGFRGGAVDKGTGDKGSLKQIEEEGLGAGGGVRVVSDLSGK